MSDTGWREINVFASNLFTQTSHFMPLFGLSLILQHRFIPYRTESVLSAAIDTNCVISDYYIQRCVQKINGKLFRSTILKITAVIPLLTSNDYLFDPAPTPITGPASSHN